MRSVTLHLSILWQKLKEGKTLCAYLIDSNLSFLSGSLSNQQIKTQHLIMWEILSRLHPDHHNVLVFDWTGSGVTRPTFARPYIFPGYFPLRLLCLIPAYVPHVCLIKKRSWFWGFSSKHLRHTACLQRPCSDVKTSTEGPSLTGQSIQRQVYTLCCLGRDGKKEFTFKISPFLKNLRQTLIIL